MNQLRTINLEDRGAAQEIVAAAYAILRNEPIEYGVSRAEAIGRSGMCIEASDAVTRAAHKLGVFAARETHDCHCITAFNPIDTLPSEDDPIICVTWGQFNSPLYDQHLAAGGEPAFFGRRQQMRERIRPVSYARNFSSDSVHYRQVTHAPRQGDSPLRDWLLTTPHDLVEGRYPVGEVDTSVFPEMSWNVF